MVGRCERSVVKVKVVVMGSEARFVPLKDCLSIVKIYSCGSGCSGGGYVVEIFIIRIGWFCHVAELDVAYV